MENLKVLMEYCELLSKQNDCDALQMAIDLEDDMGNWSDPIRFVKDNFSAVIRHPFNANGIVYDVMKDSGNNHKGIIAIMK